MRTTDKPLAQINCTRRLKIRYLLKGIHLTLFDVALPLFLLLDIRGLKPQERVEVRYSREGERQHRTDEEQSPRF